MDYEKIRSQPAKFVTLTSLSEIEFDHILPDFEKELKRIYRKTSRKTIRLNKFKWREELPSAAHHLFFVLTYMKENPTQEFHGAIFNISQESVSGIIKDCISALNETLRLKKLLPCKHGEDYADFVKALKERFANNPNVTTLDALMDCTRRQL
jgi:Helix-turn-helix of DDE superfamily endonuclease